MYVLYMMSYIVDTYVIISEFIVYGGGINKAQKIYIEK